jgi:hypothetical protein
VTPARGLRRSGRPSSIRWPDAALVIAGLGLAALIIARVLDVAPRALPAAAVAGDPLDEAHLAAMGWDLERGGDRADANTLLALAGRRSRRDRPVQAWLMQRAVEQGRWDEAMRHADAMLRTDADGALRPELFRLLDIMAADGVSRPALVRGLAARPWWREAWLVHLETAPAASPSAMSVEAARAVLMALAAGPTPPQPSEYVPYIQALVGRGDYHEALTEWRAFARRPDAGLPLRDADFAHAQDGSPFDWSSAAGVGASSEVVVPGAPVAGRALRIDYDGFSAASPTAQVLVLAPGRYRFAWRERVIGPPRLAWRIRCLGASSAVLVPPWPTGSGATGWSARAADFAVPADCPAQQLELLAIPGDRRQDVAAWFTGLSLAAGG